jgi:hypothetical protein
MHFVDFPLVRGLREIPAGPKVERVTGVEREEIGRDLAMSHFGRGPFGKEDHSPPFGGVIKVHMRRYVDVPLHRPPLGKEGANPLRDRRGQLAVGVDLYAQFEGRVVGHFGPKCCAHHKDAPVGRSLGIHLP